jgi:CheY-like chemotaxis protein
MTQESIKLLIVDDVAENLVALEALLRRDGVQALCARSGAEALELLLVHDAAIAVIDVQMPEMDGFELAELMRGAARTKHVPIMFITAARDRPGCSGLQSGAVDSCSSRSIPHPQEQDRRVPRAATSAAIHRRCGSTSCSSASSADLRFPLPG